MFIDSMLWVFGDDIKLIVMWYDVLIVMWYNEMVVVL